DCEMTDGTYPEPSLRSKGQQLSVSSTSVIDHRFDRLTGTGRMHASRAVRDGSFIYQIGH
ncbi:MAG: hypothetical protein ACO20O_10785, partial [Pseudomonadales bacterium]